MTNTDDRLCSECGTMCELNRCSEHAPPHCLACHLMLGHALKFSVEKEAALPPSISPETLPLPPDVW